jgi:benzoate membrane transport protein
LFSEGFPDPLARGPVFGLPTPIMSAIDLYAVANRGVPLFLLILLSQNLPGLVILRGAGFPVRPGPMLAVTGVTTALAAPFGTHGIDLVAITVAICVSSDADPSRRGDGTSASSTQCCTSSWCCFRRCSSGRSLPPPSFITALTGVAVIPAPF